MAFTAVPSASPALNTFPPPLGLSNPVALPRLLLTGIDVQDGGNYKVTGTTKVVGPPQTPIRVKVWLCDRLSGRVVREAWSDAATGAYSFERVRVGPFYVVSFDHTGTFNAVIADRPVPEVMP